MLKKKSSFLHKFQVIENVVKIAQKKKATILLPEGEDQRVLEATEIILSENIAKIILMGNKKKILNQIHKLKLHIPDDIPIINPATELDKTSYVQDLTNIRKHKGMNTVEAKILLEDHMYFATMMLHEGSVDGIVAGATHTTADTLRPPLQIIKTKHSITTASTFFIVLLKNQLLFFADCAMNIEPTAHQLAEIAIATAESAKDFHVDPRVALLSFSTKGSAQHPSLNKIKTALEMIKKRAPKLVIDGELQLDAALVPLVAKQKNPKSKIKGDANVLIFPDLNSGNIAYKIVQRLAHATVLGPITQGIAKPVNDLSRGCSTEDIVQMVAITAAQR